MKETNQKEFRIEKVIKKKGDKLYCKWKGYDNSFNNLIDKRDIIKWICRKRVNTFLNHMNLLQETLMLKFSNLSMQ